MTEGRAVSKAGTRTEKYLVFMALIAFALLMYGALFLPGDTYDALIKEDRWIEGPGSLALLAASVFFFMAFLQTRRSAHRYSTLLKLALLGLAFLFFFGAGEEVSWGERILGYGPPSDIANASTQGELNLHNLKGLGDIVNPDRLFQLFWFTLGIVIPVACALSSGLRRRIGSMLPVMPLLVSAALIANQALAFASRHYFDGRFYDDKNYGLGYSVFETKESVASVILAVGAFYVYRHLKRANEEVTAAAAASKPAPRRQPIGV
jgi:hypothetical protein